MKRKFLALLLVITSILCSVGCSKKTPTISDESTSSAIIENNDETSTSDEQIKPSEIETTSKEVDIEPTEAETTSVEYSTDVQPTETPIVKPTEAPTAPPTEAPTMPPTEAPTVPPTEAPTKPMVTPQTKPAIKEEPTTVHNIKPSESPTQHIHSYKSSITKPTCTEKGYITYSCSCGDSYNEENMDATGHVYTTVVTEPTCTEQGYTTYTCDDCKHQYVDDYINATGHTIVIDKSVAPTTTLTGLSEGQHCSTCNEVLVEQNIIPTVDVYVHSVSVDKAGQTIQVGDRITITLVADLKEEPKGFTVSWGCNGLEHMQNASKWSYNDGTYTMEVIYYINPYEREGTGHLENIFYIRSDRALILIPFDEEFTFNVVES